MAFIECSAQRRLQQNQRGGDSSRAFDCGESDVMISGSQANDYLPLLLLK
jgi:hypothetical protein